MMQSLGFVECDGLSGALVAADRMLKTANVKLEGIQQNIGIDWVEIKISGDISAVSAAVDAVKETMPKVYVTSTVLGSPAQGIDKLGNTNVDLLLKNRANAKKPSVEEKPAKPNDHPDSAAPVEKEAAKPSADLAEEKPKTEEAEEQEPDDKAEAEPDTDDGSNKAEDDSKDDQKVTCNLCGDPKCPRKLGEPHKKCIHYNELKDK